MRSDASLRKATGAIHIRNDINPLQRKVMNVLQFLAGPELGDMSVPFHQQPLSHVMKLAGYNSNNVGYFKETLESLVTTPVKWDLISPDGEKEWGVAALLAGAKIRAGRLTYSFAHELREKLSTSQRWAAINLRVMREFDSGAGLALFENCVVYRSVGQTPFFKLSLFRELMGSTGDSYDEFKVLNRAVIKPAIAEVNKVCDFQLEVEYKRERRHVVAVKFHIRNNDNAAAGALPLDSADQLIMDQLIEDFLLSEEIAKNLITEVDRKVLQAAMEYVGERYCRNQIQKGKLTAYFLSVVNKWDRPVEPKVSRLDAKKTVAKPEAVDPPHIAKRKEEERLAAELQATRRAEALARLSMLTEEERAKLDAGFESYVREKHTPVIAILKDKGTDHPMIRGIYSAYLQESLLEPVAAA